MKLFLLTAYLLLFSFFGFSQSPAVIVTTNGNPPAQINPGAIVVIQSTTQGLQFSRVDSTTRISITNMGGISAAGITVMDTTTNTLQYFNGTIWVSLTASGGGLGWLTTGNAGTADGTNFIGTTDNTALDFRVNNQPSGKIDQINFNTFFGYQSGFSTPSFSSGGSSNTANGYQSLYTNSFGVGNVAMGAQSLYYNNFGGANVAVGFHSLYSNSSGGENAAIGYTSLYSNTTAYQNSALGYQSLFSNTSGFGNTASGYISLFNNTTGYSNVAIGTSALYSNTTASNIVAVGDSALFNNIGIHNAALGSQASFANTTGGDNTAMGYGALFNNTTGDANTAVGAQTNAGQTGSFITLLGYGANSVDGITDATAVGSNASIGISNAIKLGDNAVTGVYSTGSFYSQGSYNGLAFNVISDGRFKFNVREDVGGLDFIMKLRPVTYQLDTRKIQNSLASGNGSVSFKSSDENEMHSMRVRRTGFIAQEVEQAADATGFDFDAVKKPENDQDHYSLSYDEFVVPLVKAVQEQEKMIDSLGQKIAQEEKINAEQNKINDDQSKKMTQLQQELDELRQLIREQIKLK
jgi:trimeric autotransporter adhesin